MSTENNSCAPRLRFPGFTGEWKEVLVKDICNINTGKSNTQDQVPDGKYPFYIRSAYPVRSNRYLYDCEAVITIGDGQIGKVFHYVNGKFDLHQRCYMMSNFTDVNCRYFYYYFSEHFYERAMRMTAKATVDSVRLEMISEMPILLPPTLAEQQKIAECLAEMDKLIAAQSQNIEALKEKKTGLLQQLFPQKGEIIPRLRFPGFKGDWIIRSVEDIFKVTRGTVLPMKEVSSMQTKEKPYAVYSSQTLNNGLAGFYKEYLYEDAITWTTDGANAGEVRFRKGKFYCTNVCGVLLSNDGYVNECIAAIINSVSKSHVSYVGNPKLTNNVMAKILITIPPTIREQQKISDCLSAIDDQIAAESAKLEALKDHKKGLMQQLFPQPAN